MVGDRERRRRSEYRRRVRLKHVVVTRLNARHRDRTNLDPEWLRRRVDLFKAYAAKSMKNQSSTDFDWIVWADLETPSPLAEEIHDIVKDVGGRVIWDRQRFSTEGLSNLLQVDMMDCDEVPEWILTTRLDSDDMIANDFIELTQSEFVLASESPTDFEIEMLSGCLFEERTRKLLQAEGGERRFVSYACHVVEEDMYFENCYRQPRPKEMVRRRKLRTRTSWMKVFHDQNCLSRLEYGKLGGMSDEVLEYRFGICGEALGKVE